MSEPADIAARTQRFNEAVRAYTPPSLSRRAKLNRIVNGDYRRVKRPSDRR